MAKRRASVGSTTLLTRDCTDADLFRVVFADLRLSGSANAQSVLVGNATVCRDVAFVDVSLAGPDTAPDPLVAVAFDKAVSCGWVRGAIGRPSSTGFTAVSLTADSQGCYVKGVDLQKNNTGADAKIDMVAAPTTVLLDNLGSTQRTAVTLGSKSAVPLSGTSIAVSTSYVGVTSTGTLSSITGRAQGDLLVLTASAATVASPLIVAEQTPGNIKLGGTSRTLNSPQDTLTLVFDGTNWLEVGFSDNA